MSEDCAEIVLMQLVQDDYITQFDEIMQHTGIEHKPIDVVKLVQD